MVFFGFFFKKFKSLNLGSKLDIIRKQVKMLSGKHGMVLSKNWDEAQSHVCRRENSKCGKRPATDKYR